MLLGISYQPYASSVLLDKLFKLYRVSLALCLTSLALDLRMFADSSVR